MLRLFVILILISAGCSNEPTAPVLTPQGTDKAAATLGAVAGGKIEIGAFGAGGRAVLKMTNTAGQVSATWYADAGTGYTDLRLFFPGSTTGYTGILPGSLGFFYDAGRYGALQMSKTDQPESIVAGAAGVCRIETETGKADLPAGYKVAGKQVIGPRLAAIADATSPEAVVVKFNLLLVALRAHGLIETEGAALTAKNKP